MTSGFHTHPIFFERFWVYEPVWFDRVQTIYLIYDTTLVQYHRKSKSAEWQLANYIRSH